MAESIAVVIPAYNEEKYIGLTLESLYACALPDSQVNVVVINNVSTDRTDEVVNLFSIDHPDFPLSIIDEPNKGTGIACNTGFRYSIDQLGADIIARTDSDTILSRGWLKVIESTFVENKIARLITGPVKPLRDEWYRAIDSFAFPMSQQISRMLMAPKLHTLPTKRLLTPGHNMATKSSTYETVDGFPASSIDDTNEDIEFRSKVVEKFGLESLDFSDEMIVYTSMRRMRQVGYLGLLSYYGNKSNREKRLKASKGIIDVR